MNFDNLKTMKREQLLELAGTQGLKVHPRAKDETVIKQIMEAAHTPQKIPEMKHAAEKPAKPVDHNTPDDVEAAIADIKSRVPEFVTKYNAQENTWKFSCKGAEETGNLDIPLRVIKMKAQNISRGRLAPMGLNQHFDTVSSSIGKNAYTNTVLAG